MNKNLLNIVKISFREVVVTVEQYIMIPFKNLVTTFSLDLSHEYI